MFFLWGGFQELQAVATVHSFERERESPIRSLDCDPRCVKEVRPFSGPQNFNRFELDMNLPFLQGATFGWFSIEVKRKPTILFGAKNTTYPYEMRSSLQCLAWQRTVVLVG